MSGSSETLLLVILIIYFTVFGLGLIGFRVQGLGFRVQGYIS